MKGNIKFFSTLADANGCLIKDIPFTGYIKENGLVIYCDTPNQYIVVLNNIASLLHFDLVFDTLQDADGYVIEVAPCKIFIIENKLILFCNESGKKLKLENGVIIISDLIDLVDLGLPSGVLWAAYNLGASKPEEYGGFYAWAETEPKLTFSWDNYKYANGAYNKLTKYCSTSKSQYWDSSVGPVDGKSSLELEDDASYKQLGNLYRNARATNWSELVSNTTKTLQTINGVTGYLYTSNINGKSIFFPTSIPVPVQYYTLPDFFIEERRTNLPFEAYSVTTSNIQLWSYSTARYIGMQIRPVKIPN